MRDVAARPDAAAAPKLPYEEFKAMLMDVDVPDARIAWYLTADRRESSAFRPALVPDASKVEMTPEADFDVESAIRWGNAISRWRRQQRFNQAIAQGVGKPVLVSDGDSYCQFPFLIDDLVDHLGKTYLIWSLDAAGDRLDDMVNRRPEYMEGLRTQKANGVKGFIFSAAGNDVIGEDILGQPVLRSLLKHFQAGEDAAWHIDAAALGEVISRLRAGYLKVIGTVRQEFPDLPIFVHGYDYAIPGGFAGDPRRPIHARQDEWLGGPMKAKGIQDTRLQRAIIKILIDALYDMLESVALASSRVHVVELRNTLPDVGEWADEIHVTSAGFATMAAKFDNRIRAAIGR